MFSESDNDFGTAEVALLALSLSRSPVYRSEFEREITHVLRGCVVRYARVCCR